MRSFRSAIQAGCDLIECDVHLSSDGRLVVIHDHTLERTTNGEGLVRDHTAAELMKLDAGEGERIPLLHDVIELALGKVGLVIEIKQLPIVYPGLEEKLVNMLRQLGAVQECAVVSFHHPAIRKLRDMEPRLQLGILEGARPMDPGRPSRLTRMRPAQGLASTISAVAAIPLRRDSLSLNSVQPMISAAPTTTRATSLASTSSWTGCDALTTVPITATSGRATNA